MSTAADGKFAGTRWCRCERAVCCVFVIVDCAVGVGVAGIVVVVVVVVVVAVVADVVVVVGVVGCPFYAEYELRVN